MDAKELQAIKNHFAQTEYEKNLKIISLKKPKSPIVLFFGRETFSDNSKYLYLDACRNNYGFAPVWCSFNTSVIEELRAQKLNALDLSQAPAKNIALLIKAALCVFSINPNESARISSYIAALEGAKKVQLWHGVGTKQLDLALTDKADMASPKFIAQLAQACNIDYILSPAKTWDSQWREFFGVKKIIRAGMPRNEVLCRMPFATELIGSYKQIFKSQASFKILWAPTYTFVGDQAQWMDQNIYEKITAPFIRRQIKFELVIKPHPYDFRFEAQNKHNPLVIESTPDVYPFLREVDLLITDKSSIFTDFLHCNKPIIFIKNNKLNEIAEKNIFLTQLPGLETELRDVEAAIESVLTEDVFARARAQLRGLAFETSPESACQEINTYFSSLVPELLL